MRKTPIDLATAAESFLSHCERARGLSANTLRAYAQDLTDFIGFAGARTPVGSIDGATILAFVDDLRIRRGRKPRTIRRRIACLKAFFKHIQKTHAVKCSPFSDLDLAVPVPNSLPKSLSREEVGRLAQCAVAPISTIPRDGLNSNITSRLVLTNAPEATTYLSILLLCATGMRVGELTALRLCDVDPNAGSIRVAGKGGRERRAFVTDTNIQRLLRIYHRSRLHIDGPTAPLFLNKVGNRLTAQALRLRLRTLADRSRLGRHVTPHMLRHTAATLLLESGLDIRFVQRLLGHQCITTTELYTHVSDSSLRAALHQVNALAELTTSFAKADN